MNNKDATILNQRYLLTSILGKGGQATVYRAQDQLLHVERAIKVLSQEGMKDKSSRDRFHVEAQAMAKVEHSGVVKIYDIVESNQHFFIVMELLKGGTLWHWVKEHGKMPERMVCQAMLKVVESLIAVHDGGIIHRDVKPHNMLLNEAGEIKLTDFGIARGDKSFTQTGLVIGTFGYMAPEQIENSKNVTKRSDIFSIGACLYALCRGKSPKTISLVHHKPSLLDGFSAGMKEIILKATQYEPTERYETVREIYQAIEKTLQTLPEIPTETCSLMEHAKNMAREPQKPVEQKELPTVQQLADATFLPETVLSTTKIVPAKSMINYSSTSRSKFVGFSVFLLVVAIIAGLWWPGSSTESNTTPETESQYSTKIGAMQAAKVCLSWAKTLAERQKPDGGFSGIMQVDAAPWDTGQQLTALMYAEKCGFSNPAAERKAIERLKQWFSSKSFDSRLYDSSWALVYLSHKDSEVAQMAAANLEQFRLENGSYKGHIEDTAANVYATVLAAWALSQKAENKDMLHDTVQYLQDIVFTDLPVALDEQLWWVLNDIGTRFPELKPSSEHTLGMANRIIERCQIVNGSCSILTWPDGKINLRQPDKDASIVELQGAPWVVAAAYSLTKLALPQDILEKVNMVFTWSVESRLQAAPHVSTAPGYKLSENLLTLALVIDDAAQRQQDQ